MIEVTESSGTGAGGMPPTTVAKPGKRLTFLADEAEQLATPPQAIDEATAAALEETRQAFFGVRDAGAPNRIEQGQLLLKAQAQLARYGTGTFTAMLLAPRPKGFALRSASCAYELMAEAAGKPKRSHKTKHGKAKQGTDVSTPGRSNAQPEFLPINLDGASSPVDPVGIPDDQPAALDTSHTRTYVPFGLKGVYVPKADVEGFTTWLQAFSSAELSTQFLAWYRAANPSSQEESK
jgi:hypothetical protein